MPNMSTSSTTVTSSTSSETRSSEATSSNNQPITIYLNGEMTSLPTHCHLADAVFHYWQYRPGTVAVALNARVIPAKDYASTWIQPGDQLDVVSAMQGG